MGNDEHDLGELLMVLGDLHVPQRSLFLPPCFKRLLKTDKIKRVICTGNVGSKEMLEVLNDISPSLHIVQGDYDDDFDHPDTLTLSVGDLKIGVINGYQIPTWNNKDLLLKVAVDMNVDILVYGHSHVSDISKHGGKIFVNPGSATGCYQPWQPNSIPTFMLMAIQGSKVVIYVYEEHDGEAQVIMTELDNLESGKAPSHTANSSSPLPSPKNS
ncbi:vacuolar protein sorting, VPS29 homologue, putative [Theileria annulata]|uniref:Vacuolar protein sorting-associated protein 29 n=1 Tax=Theileria annulata TaxID=5874 RepID=Q4U8P6_THEAN|nr:vacuolar protein sorting, VPS29 homologue, putative [Theileria annulata]CAI76807.1 vacuolar protein sorting, VPS29 homologue, putative [Theileria annulata]|eukprot:XP_953432.1 vacuolar protein sorting, VPS29 homologue, putative [Theileria annulata]